MLESQARTAQRRLCNRVSGPHHVQRADGRGVTRSKKRTRSGDCQWRRQGPVEKVGLSREKGSQSPQPHLEDATTSRPLRPNGVTKSRTFVFRLIPIRFHYAANSNRRGGFQTRPPCPSWLQTQLRIYGPVTAMPYYIRSYVEPTVDQTSPSHIPPSCANG